MTGIRADSTDLALLFALLPAKLQVAVSALDAEALVEIVLDLGRRPEARLTDRAVPLGEEPVEQPALDQIVERVGAFNEDNRAGIERTLHRVSAIRNRQGRIIGLTLRVGRAAPGSIAVLRDLVESGMNILLLGPPGIGKTTKLREIARVLADDLQRRVMIIDTSNELAGDGDVPHPAIGSARRMQVPRAIQQHAVMIEAVENHMPQVIVVDEIGTESEAAAARTIAERGVQLIGTAHGNTLENLVLNPTLADLIGGVHTVTLSDEEAHRRRTQKTVRERRAPPTFDVVVEMLSRDEVIVHRDTAEAVDRLLSGAPVPGEKRRLGAGGALETEAVTEPRGHLPAPLPTPASDVFGRKGTVRLHPYGLSRDLLDRVLRELRIDAKVVDRPENADVIIALRSRENDPRLRAVAGSGVRVHLVKRNSSAQIRRMVQTIFMLVGGTSEDEVREAVQEVEHAVRRVLGEGVPMALAPRRPALRRLQHRLVSRYQLDAESVGSEPTRHLLIHPS